MPPDRSVRPFHWLTLLLLAGAGALWYSGAFQVISDTARLTAIVERTGVWGPVLFVLLAIVAFPLLLLGPPVWTSTVLWPWPLAYLYSYIACVAASFVTYALARWLGYDWAQRRVPEKLRRYEERLESRPFATVMVLRLGLWGNPLVDVLIAVTKVPPRSYLTATVLALIPATGAQILIGLGGLTMIRTLPAWVWVAAAAAAIGLTVAVRLRKRRQLAPRSIP
jgi:uncharacterized membrane protein YdjX (TVP38/TMEM64 family)